MEKMESVIKELFLFSEGMLEVYPPADPISILEFENRFGLTLPNDYKFLLKFTNGFLLSSEGVYGLRDKNGSVRVGLHELYESEHFQVENPQPLYLVPFWNDGRGNFYCFDIRTLNDISCNIVFWQSNYTYSSIDHPEIVNEELSDWIKEEVINFALEDYNYDGSER